MSVESNVRIHLQGLVGALRFAWLPIVCAAVVALASGQSRGREYAIALAVASIVLGVAVHAREIVRGRPARRLAPGERPNSAGDWMAQLR